MTTLAASIAGRSADAASIPPEDPRATRELGFSWFSEQSWANRYLFRNVYQWRWSSRWPGFLEGHARDGRPMASPIDLAAPLGPRVARAILDAGFLLGPLGRASAEALLGTLGPRYAAAASRAQSDYVYSSARIAELAGPQHAKARQHVNRLQRSHGAYAEPFASRHAAEATGLTHAWLERRAPRGRVSDVAETLAAIELATVGTIAGVATFVDGRMAGFVLADATTIDVLVALVLKTRDQQGVTDFCFRELCRCFPNKRYLNTCQDLGVPGLRTRKLRMAPIAIVDKFFVSRGNG